MLRSTGIHAELHNRQTFLFNHQLYSITSGRHIVGVSSASKRLSQSSPRSDKYFDEKRIVGDHSPWGGTSASASCDGNSLPAALARAALAAAAA